MTSILIAPVLLLLAVAGEPAPAVTFIFNKRQPDGSHYIKAKFEGDTFLIRVSRDRIMVDRREKVGRRNTGPDQRERMRRIAQILTGCELRHESFNAWQFALEADLSCPTSGNQVLGE